MKKPNRNLIELRRRFQRPTKDGSDFEPDTMSSFQRTPASRRPANTYSALSFDRINYFNISHLLPRTQTSLSLDENVRAKEGAKETTGEASLRLPLVPLPWSFAVHHQSLASTLRKTKRLRSRIAHLHFDLNLLSMENLAFL